MATTSPDPPQPRLLDQLRDRIRFKHYSIRTEYAYADWVKRFILFHGKRHPSQLAKEHVEAFLTHLAVAGKVSASTQNQAKSAILFLYREVLGIELAWLDDVESAKAPRRLPVVLTQSEVAAVLGRMTGIHALMGRLLYGTGCASWKWFGCASRTDRVTMLRESVLEPLRSHPDQIMSARD